MTLKGDGKTTTPQYQTTLTGETINRKIIHQHKMITTKTEPIFESVCNCGFKSYIRP